MQKRVYLKCVLLVLFLALYALASQLLAQQEEWSQAHFNKMWLEPSRALAFFLLSIAAGLFLRLPVTGKPKRDSLLSGVVLGALTVVQVIFYFAIGPFWFWPLSHYLFTLWLPLMAVCAGLAIAGKVARRKPAA